MKKFLQRALSVLLFLLLLSFTASAQEFKEHTVDRSKMVVNLPSDWSVFTPDTTADDPNLAKFDFDWDSLVKQMEYSGICISALRENPKCEISVKIYEDESSKAAFNYAALSAERLEEERLSLKNRLDTASETATYTDPQPIEHTQAIFFQDEVHETNEDCPFYGLENRTVINGQSISISIYNLEGNEIDEKMRSLLSEVTSSVRFEKIYTDPAEAEQELYPPSSLFSTFRPLILLVALIGGIFLILWLITFFIQRHRKASIRKTLNRVVTEQEKRKELEK